MKVWVFIIMGFLIMGISIPCMAEEPKREGPPPLLGEVQPPDPEAPTGLGQTPKGIEMAVAPPVPGTPRPDGPPVPPPEPGGPPSLPPRTGGPPVPPPPPQVIGPKSGIEGPPQIPPTPEMSNRGTIPPQPPKKKGPNPLQPTPKTRELLPPPGSPMQGEILENLGKALNTAKILTDYLKPGNVWMIRGPKGNAEIKGAIMYRGQAIGCIRLDPVTGHPLPKGYHKRVFTQTQRVDMNLISERFREIFSELTILNGAEYAEPEASWMIPLTWQGRIVGFVKIYYDGVHVVPDEKTQEEMVMFSYR